jgi:hypothetical protein
MDIINLLNIILAVSSITLSIVAIIFSWVAYRNTTKMQVDVQSILEKITQRVEVIVQNTNQQIDKAWNYFTNPDLHKGKIDEPTLDLDTVRKEIINEANLETQKLLINSSIDRNKLEELSTKVEGLIDRTTNKAEELYSKKILLDKIEDIRDDFEHWIEKGANIKFASNFPLDKMYELLKTKADISVRIDNYLRTIIAVRNKIINNENIGNDEIIKTLELISLNKNIFRKD